MRGFSLKFVWVVVASVGVAMATVSVPVQASGKAGLRILCDGEARNADVTINGKPFGSCPMDIEIPAGRIDLQVSKADATGTSRVFRESFTLVGGALRRVEVTPQAMKPVFTQTREETIAWILETLRGRYPHSFRIERDVIRVDDFKVAITEQGVFQVTWKEYWPQTRVPTGRKMNFNEWRAAGEPRDMRVYETLPASTSVQYLEFPVSAIEAVHIESDSIGPFRIVFRIDPAQCGPCRETRNSGRGPQFDRSGASIGSTLDFPFNKPSEQRFDERFVNAFMHLKTFYPPPQATRRGF